MEMMMMMIMMKPMVMMMVMVLVLALVMMRAGQRARRYMLLCTGGEGGPLLLRAHARSTELSPLNKFWKILL